MHWIEKSGEERRAHMQGPAFDKWLREVVILHPELASMSRDVQQGLFMLIEDEKESDEGDRD